MCVAEVEPESVGGAILDKTSDESLAECVNNKYDSVLSYVELAMRKICTTVFTPSMNENMMILEP